MTDNRATSIKANDELLEHSHGLFDHNYSGLANSTSAQEHQSVQVGGSTTSPLFFVFPVLGFLFLVLGSVFLRKRQQQQDADAIRNYNARIECVNAEKELKIKMRTEMVKKSLVTTNATLRKPKRFDSRSRNVSMETDITYMSGGSDSSSCGSSEMERRRSDLSICSDEEDRLNSTQTDQEHPATIFSNTSSSSTASEVLNIPSSESLVLEIGDGSMKSELETCAICLEPYRENDSVSYSKHQNCAHAFHTDCIVSWLKDEHRNDCPYCRGPYLHLCVHEEDGEYFGNNSSVGTNNINESTTDEGDNSTEDGDSNV